MHSQISDAIEQSRSISLNGVSAGLLDYSYFAEPNQSRDEVQLAIFGTQFTFAQLDKAVLDPKTGSWCVGEHRLQLTR